MLSSEKTRLRHGIYLKQVYMVPGQEKYFAHSVGSVAQIQAKPLLGSGHE